MIKEGKQGLDEALEKMWHEIKGFIKRVAKEVFRELKGQGVPTKA